MNDEPDEHQQPHRATTWQTMSNESTRPGQTRLSDSQHLAIDVLLTGGTHREAAEAAGVARTTVTEWVNHRSEFCRELERRRWQRAEQVNDRVGALTTRSLDVIEKHVSAGDLRAALGVLRLLPREALYRAPTPPLTAQQGEDVGAMLRARLARLETLPDPPDSST